MILNLLMAKDVILHVKESCLAGSALSYFKASLNALPFVETDFLSGMKLVMKAIFEPGVILIALAVNKAGIAQTQVQHNAYLFVETGCLSVMRFVMTVNKIKLDVMMIVQIQKKGSDAIICPQTSRLNAVKLIQKFI